MSDETLLLWEGSPIKLEFSEAALDLMRPEGPTEVPGEGESYGVWVVRIELNVHRTMGSLCLTGPPAADLQHPGGDD